MFGTIELTVAVSSLPNQTGAFTVGLFDPSAYSDYSDVLYETALVGGNAEFKDVNPGNYVIVVEYTGLHHGVQVRGGKTTSVRIN